MKIGAFFWGVLCIGDSAAPVNPMLATAADINTITRLREASHAIGNEAFVVEHMARRLGRRSHALERQAKDALRELAEGARA